MDESYSSIKNIIFDLDGVLVDSRKLHYDALNNALLEIDSSYVITLEEHLAKYDGLPTTKKLQLLSVEKGLPVELYEEVWKRKQHLSTKLIKNSVKPSSNLMYLMQKLSELGYTLFCASNSIRKTLDDTLECLGILQVFAKTYSNEDVKYCKPHPNIYIKCFADNQLVPQQCMIIEDSPIGRTAAHLSGAHLCAIANPEQLTLDLITKSINKCNAKNLENKVDLRWLSDVQVVIPMAGDGTRFVIEGFSTPKPLIDVNGKPMIEWVIGNMNLAGAKYIFIVRSSHLENPEWKLRQRLEQSIPGCVIVSTDSLTRGPAESVLLAESLLDVDKPLLIANSDQFLEWDVNAFMYESQQVDGCISVFRQSDTNDKKWSYIKLGDNGLVVDVQEKVPISDIASTGIYYWKKSDDFIKYAKRMIEKNIRVNNEFYVAPVYNEAIADGKKIKVSFCKKMWGLGLPTDLREFKKSYLGISE